MNFRKLGLSIKKMIQPRSREFTSRNFFEFKKRPVVGAYLAQFFEFKKRPVVGAYLAQFFEFKKRGIKPRLRLHPVVGAYLAQVF